MPVRIVLDTNVLVSALISRNGPPGRMLARMLAEVKRAGLKLITSAAQLRELRNVLDREQLRRYIRRDEAEDLIRNLEAVGEVVTDLPDVNVSTDPDDNLILAAAVAGRADMIVSGDRKHMLALGAVEGIPIVTARDAVRQLRGQQPR